MRCVPGAFAIVGLIALFQPLAGLSAAPLDLDTIAPDEPPEQLCDRLAANPFAGFGPDEWGRPFGSIDSYRAIPACMESMKLHPHERRFVLEAALAYIAGKKNEEAKPLLQRLIGEGNTSAMLALAYISPEPEAADLMRKAAEAGDPNGMMLFGMAQMTGQGVPKNEIDGVRMIRRAAEAGSTRAMLLMANFYNKGLFGVGLNPQEANNLISRAADLGDPSAKAILANLVEGDASSAAEPH
jgi:TPR repeat protein